MKGLHRRLMAGIPRITPDRSVEILDSGGVRLDLISNTELEASDYGFVYERRVGLHYEALGYDVEYRSVYGFLDQGIDLVARKGQETRFIQCKGSKRTMGKQRVEWILYKASAYIHKHAYGPDQYFELVIPSMAKVFPDTVTKGGRVKENLHKQRFLAHNRQQNRVKLVITELTFTDHASR